jgi:hypothetical protein
MAGYVGSPGTGGIPSGSINLGNDSGFTGSTAGTAYAYRTPEQYGADYGILGRLGNKLFGTNHAAESAAGAYNAEIQNKFNADEAQKNRDFQEYMSSTAYQRMMQDAKKAGINPYYLVQHGSSGESSPAGSAASSASSPEYGDSSGKGKGALASVAATALSLVKLAAILLA